MPHLLKIISFLFAITVTAYSQAQTVDWYESFFVDGKYREVEKALELREKKLLEARAGGDYESQVTTLIEIGLLHLTRTYDQEKAMNYLIRSLTLEDSIDLSMHRVFTYVGIARVFRAVGNFNKSAEFLNKALLQNAEGGDAAIKGLIQNELGEIQLENGEAEAALKNFESILSSRKEINKPSIESKALFNLAQLYTRQEKYEQALRHHKRALVIRRSIGDRENEARSLNTIGELYRLMKNTAKATDNHRVALSLRNSLTDIAGVAESYNNIAILDFESANYTDAIKNFELALHAGQESQNQHQLSKSYEYLSECYEAMEDYKQALEYKDLFLAIRELIHGEMNEQRLLETQNRYVIGQQESQIETLEFDSTIRKVELARQTKNNQRLLLFVALILAAGGVIVVFYLEKRRSAKLVTDVNARLTVQQTELQELNATKDKFFSIISHDLKGPLNSLSSFSNLLINYTDSLSKEEIQTFAKDFDKSLKNLFALLENLLEWSRSQTGNIDFTPDRFEICAILESNKDLLESQAKIKSIWIQSVARSELYIDAHKNSINTVVRNLISNAIKFTQEGGRIELDARKKGNEVIISVADTGVGMSEAVINRLFRIDAKHSTKGTANEKGTGLGLILCKEFIEKNGGRIWVESKEGEGTIFFFALPQSQ